MRNAPRTLAVIWVSVLVACGGGKKASKDDAGPPADAAQDAPPACASPVSGSTITARLIGQVPGGALLTTSPPGDPRLFVLDQSGLIRIFENEQLVATPFLDISNMLVAGGEQGLLGLAFHPKYATNGTFFVDYTTSNKDVVAKCQVGTNPNQALAASCISILEISDPFSNHNAGMIEFGNDGYLYISTGDGGSGGDPNRNAQSLTNGQITPSSNAMLGKILRIDVDHPDNGKMYGIPTDNPFATSGGLPEIWMYGLRNPWRWSFDRANGDMWIGDVGQGVTEEINVLKSGAQAGKNLGWSVYEGMTCCKTQGDKCTQTGTQADCTLPDMVAPLDMRTHGNGWTAIIGGQVYRGSCYPDMVGWYFYSDNGHGHLAKAKLNASGALDIVDLPGTFPANPASIHADSRGELFITTSSVPGKVYHIEAGP